MIKELKFKISSGLKNIIGKELITNDLIAIFELVKNSYDAGAKNVRIIFQNVQTKDKKNKPKIFIIDDGEGMSKEELKDKFLFVGYSEKRDVNEAKKGSKDFRDKVQKRRMFAGAKGVGRFSCDKLGSKLNLYTKKINENSYHTLAINWNQFEEDQKKEFQTINVKYNTVKSLKLENIDLKKIKTGTILEINCLNNEWNWDDLVNLKRYLQRLINPTQVEKHQEFNIFLEANEFKEKDVEAKKDNKEWDVINDKIKNIVFEKLEIKTAEIVSSIDEKGERIITELYDKDKFIFRLKEKNTYTNLRNIRIKLFFLNTEAKKTFTRMMGLEPVKYGSIFLYKNEIRIHPYGDEGDDWLGLEKRKGQGYARFLATRELIGRIEISGLQPHFIEVSSRDGGIVKNDSYSNLLNFFIKKVLRRLEKYVIEGIDWEKENSTKTSDEIKRDSLELIQKITGQVKDPEKEIEFNKNLLKIVQKKEIEKIPELIKNVEKLNKFIKKKEHKDYIATQLKSFRKATSQLKKEKKTVEKELEVTKKTSLFLSKAISSDKDIILNLNHTIENSTLDIKDTLDEVNQKIKEKKPIKSIIPMIDEISIENEKIRVLAGIVSQANFNMKVEWITKDIIVYIEDYLKKIRHGAINFNFLNTSLKFTTRFRPLEISIMLDNLITNAKKAKATEISIDFKIKKKELFIVISDNGKGIKKDTEKYIFKRGYTTTDGSGIGLAHIQSILESMNGTIKLRDNNKYAKGACFEIRLK